MARWYVNELVYYGNETSKVQGFKSRTKDGENSTVFPKEMPQC
ncbi:unnamed protein product [Musa acuminata subsp. malaccensis]|nr:unnamed protein product [Musa acuminata subsp. malaccensis]